jgi:hypothetical protein
VYDSSSVGEIVSESGDVVEAVRGIIGRSSEATSIRNRADREWRCAVLGAVQAMQHDGAGIHASAAVRDRLRLEEIAHSLRTRRVGRLTSGGGITPARSLRIHALHNAGRHPTLAESRCSSDRFAVFIDRLWQVTQY